ncbi:hypothetical protein PSP6_580138 [Paraburkholderia tropica]|nr:hypothetical protein PSP6_580138 [Paraburkholderia tropica]
MTLANELPGGRRAVRSSFNQSMIVAGAGTVYEPFAQMKSRLAICECIPASRETVQRPPPGV